MLTIRIQPDEGFSLGISCKLPGPHVDISPVKMDFHYGETFGAVVVAGSLRAAAARRDGRRPDAVHAPRRGRGGVALGDADPRALGGSRPLRCRPTPPGTWGPPEADRLIESTGRNLAAALMRYLVTARVKPGQRRGARSRDRRRLARPRLGRRRRVPAQHGRGARSSTTAACSGSRSATARRRSPKSANTGRPTSRSTRCRTRTRAAAAAISNGTEPWACSDCDCTARLEAHLARKGRPFRANP